MLLIVEVGRRRALLPDYADHGYHISSPSTSGDLRSFGVQVTEVVRAALARLDAVADLGAVVCRDDDASLAAVAALDAEVVKRAWAGAIVTVKDWIDVAGMACEGASTQRTGRVPERDATAVARLRAAGAIVIAKTQPGADHPIHGRCHHPLDDARTPGGSSSGEAALLAVSASVFGLGSDSGGSIRLPAAWCGVAGLKPSFGLVPNTGHRPRVGGRNDGRTVIGPMARRVADLSAMLSVIAGPDEIDPDCAPVELTSPVDVHAAGLRVAVVDDEGSWRAAPSTRDAVQRAVDVLAGLGAVIVDEPLPAHLDESLDITERYWQRTTLTGAEADRQLRDWDRFAGRLIRAAANFDVVIGPVVADVAPLDRPLTGEDYVFTLPWSLTGWPAVSVPAGSDPRTASRSPSR